MKLPWDRGYSDPLHQVHLPQFTATEAQQDVLCPPCGASVRTASPPPQPHITSQTAAVWRKILAGCFSTAHAWSGTHWERACYHLMFLAKILSPLLSFFSIFSSDAATIHSEESTPVLQPAWPKLDKYSSLMHTHLLALLKLQGALEMPARPWVLKGFRNLQPGGAPSWYSAKTL